MTEPKSSSLHEGFSFCRMCAATCSMKVSVDATGQIVDLRGNHNSPLSRGYACFKGLQSAKAHSANARLLSPQKRMPDGSFQPIASEQAFDEIGEKIASIVDQYGPNAVACYNGTGSLSPVEWTTIMGFLAGLGSHQFFTTMTIDQSAKQVSAQRMGSWAAGSLQLAESDVAMIFGANPLVSHSVLGLLSVDPTKRLKSARRNGLSLIVVDPRRTETARQADLFLQPLPGRDAHIAAAMIRIILAEQWHDQGFCQRFVGADRMADLQAAVEPFDAELVEAYAGLHSGDIRRAAELFARTNKRGIAATATGTSMSPFSNLARQLVDTLNVVCGRFPRAGDAITVTDVINPMAEVREGVIAPARMWESGAPSRIRGAGGFYGQRMTGTLADEILTPGEGQIKCLIIDGANPGNANPAQAKMARALKELDLLVTIDPFPTVTATQSDYIIAPLMQYERADLPPSLPGFNIFPESWVQYAEPVAKPPPGSDVVVDWYVYWSLAKRLGYEINFRGTPLSREVAPSTDDLLAILAANAAVDLDVIKEHRDGGFVLPPTTQKVMPADDNDQTRFDVMPNDVLDELNQAYAVAQKPKGAAQSTNEYPFLLASRRLRDMVNSGGFFVDSIRSRLPGNPAHLHPDDMAALGLKDGDEIKIQSKDGELFTVVKPDNTLKPGVVTLPHSWGGLPGDGSDWRDVGSCVNLLTNDDTDFEPINAMPHLSAIPVRVAPL